MALSILKRLRCRHCHIRVVRYVVDRGVSFAHTLVVISVIQVHVILVVLLFNCLVAVEKLSRIRGCKLWIDKWSDVEQIHQLYSVKMYVESCWTAKNTHVRWCVMQDLVLLVRSLWNAVVIVELNIQSFLVV